MASVKWVALLGEPVKTEQIIVDLLREKGVRNYLEFRGTKLDSIASDAEWLAARQLSAVTVSIVTDDMPAPLRKLAEHASFTVIGCDREHVLSAIIRVIEGDGPIDRNDPKQVRPL